MTACVFLGSAPRRLLAGRRRARPWLSPPSFINVARSRWNRLFVCRATALREPCAAGRRFERSLGTFSGTDNRSPIPKDGFRTHMRPVEPALAGLNATQKPPVVPAAWMLTSGASTGASRCGKRQLDFAAAALACSRFFFSLSRATRGASACCCAHCG